MLPAPISWSGMVGNQDGQVSSGHKIGRTFQPRKAGQFFILGDD
jgi:hypothetical protein